MAFGDYPAAYNPTVHGPFDPARFYGKPDTPLAQVKVGEIGAWLARRNKSPQAMMGGVSRAWWRWQHKYMQPKRAGIAPFFQLVVASMTFFYVINYGKINFEANVETPATLIIVCSGSVVIFPEKYLNLVGDFNDTLLLVHYTLQTHKWLVYNVTTNPGPKPYDQLKTLFNIDDSKYRYYFAKDESLAAAM